MISASRDGGSWPARRLTITTLLALLTGALIAIGLASQTFGEPAEQDEAAVRAVGNGDLPTKRPKLRAARAPLSAQETGYAVHLASKASEIPAGATDVRGKPGPQLLFTDLPRIAEAEGDRRLAAVMLYDYTSDRAYQVLVDLTESEVLSADSDATLQPPPAADEADAAFQLALKTDEELIFRGQFESETGVPLLSTDQVLYRAGVWTHDGTTAQGQTCGENRCVQLVVQTPSGGYLDTSDFVVDLSNKSIVITK